VFFLSNLTDVIRLVVDVRRLLVAAGEYQFEVLGFFLE